MAKQHGIPDHEGTSLYPYGDTPTDFGEINDTGSSLSSMLSGFGAALSPVEAALILERQRHEFRLADLLLGHRTDIAPATPQTSTPNSDPSSDGELIAEFLRKGLQPGQRITATPAGRGRVALPAGPAVSRQPFTGTPNVGRQPAPANTPESDDTKDGNFFYRHRKALGAFAFAAGLGLFVSINVVPPAKAFAQGTPVIEKLVVFGDDNETTADTVTSPESTTNELIASLPNMTPVAEPLLGKPLLITEALPDQPMGELSQQVNITYTSPEGTQITLDDMLRLTSPNVLLGAFNFTISPEDLKSNLKYVGDNTFELSLDAINPEAILNSGLKPDGTPITAVDLESETPPESVILGGNKMDYLWKAVTTAGALDSNKAVIDYINATYGTNAAAINKALKDNGPAIASHMSSEAIVGLLQDPIFFAGVIEDIQNKINGYINSNLPNGKGVKMEITFTDEAVKDFIFISSGAYAENDKPLTSGMSYKGTLTGLKAPTMDTES